MSIFTDVLTKIFVRAPVQEKTILSSNTNQIPISKLESQATPQLIGGMQLSKQGKAEIAGYEGICTAPYKDSVGVWTFGIGCTRSDGPPNPQDMEKGIDHPIEEIFALFQNKIQRYVNEVNSAIHVSVTQQQFDALVSFHYNTGAIGHSSLALSINGGASNDVITHNFMQWTHGGGRVITGLVTRRRNEAKLYTQGVYNNGGMALITTADINGRELVGHARDINVLQYIS